MQHSSIKIEKIIKETSDTFTLVLENDPAILNYRPGQFINVFCKINGKKVNRSYSFSSTPLLKEPPAVTIKKMLQGIVSNYLAESVSAGGRLEVSSPAGRFTTKHDKGNKRHLLMIAGGSGITPVFSILKSVLYHEPDSSVTLYYANRNSGSIIFKDILSDLVTDYYGRFEVVHFLETVEVSNSSNEKVIPGRISKIILQEFLRKTHKASLEVFICGPDGLMDFAVTTLLQLGLAKEKIQSESFLPGKTQIPASPPPNREKVQVKIRSLNGKNVHFEASKGQPILFSAFDQSYKLPHSCREAMCGSCKAKLVFGKVEMKENYALTDDDLQDGYVLLCSSMPRSSEVILIYE